MMNSLGKICTVLAVALLALTAGAMAAPPISTIAQGNTVFLGEAGLDITGAMGPYDRIGWWASAASISMSSPSKTIQVSSPTAFSVSPTDFSGYLGTWYRLDGGNNATGAAFIVADPNLDIRVDDATVGVDATANGWITSGDAVSFRILTNLDQIAQRPGVSGVPIRIHVQSPDGASYSALIDQNGMTTSIDPVLITSNPYSTGPIWDTGRYDTYPSGTYAIWAECNVNSMKDNYGYVGRTYTNPAGLRDQGANPLITARTSTYAPTTVATREPTTAKTLVTTTVTTAATVVTTPPTAPPTIPVTPTKTKSPGFEFLPAGAALLLALAWSVRKE
jgi:hypothetical protein